MAVYYLRDPLRGEERFRVWRRNALATVLLLAGVIAVSTLGFALLETGDRTMSDKLLDGLWNAVNLLSTLGDFTGFNPAQKRFMIVMVLAAIVIGGVAITRLTGLLSSEEVVLYRENRAMMKELASISGHVIVVGYEAVGQLVAGQLRDRGEKVVVVVADESLAALSASNRFLTVSGSASTDDTVLTNARIDTARALIVATSDPDRDLVITLTAHAANPGLEIAVYGESSRRKALLHRAGASVVISTADILAAALVDQLPGRDRRPPGADRG